MSLTKKIQTIVTPGLKGSAWSFDTVYGILSGLVAVSLFADRSPTPAAW